MEKKILPRQRHLDFLATVRAYELGVAVRHFPSSAAFDGSCRLLELGAGTGVQAKQLSELGYKVTALEIADSHYRNVRCFDVIEYDGVSIPLPDRSHNVVFSSHVLEHVVSLDAILSETYRVLEDGGVCVHLIPTPACRVWTLAAHYIWLLRRIVNKLVSKKNSGDKETDAPRTPDSAKEWLWTMFPRRHGERGSAVNEAYYYSRGFWKKKFNENNFEVVIIESNDLFYTMANSLGHNLSIRVRKFFAPVFGGACYIYVLKKKGLM